MSSIALHYCGDDISDYAYSDMSYDYSDDDTHEGSLSAYDQINEVHQYDGEFFEIYDSSRDYDWHCDEKYYIKDEYEMHRVYGSFDEHEKVEVSYDEFYKGYVGSYITHHGDKDDVRYDYFFLISYELFQKDCDRRGSCRDELLSLSCVTYYPSWGV